MRTIEQTLSIILALLLLPFVYWYASDEAFRLKTNVISYRVLVVILVAALLCAAFLIAKTAINIFYNVMTKRTEYQMKRLEYQMKRTFIYPDASGLYPRLLEQQQSGAMTTIDSNAYALHHTPRYASAGYSSQIENTLPSVVNYRDYAGSITQGRIILGVDASGAIVDIAISSIWHMLGVASSGNGKTNLFDLIITQLHYSINPSDMHLIDYKGELAAAWQDSHRVTSSTDGYKTTSVLRTLSALALDVRKRNKLFTDYASKNGSIVRNLASYNKHSGAQLKSVFLMIDEGNTLLSSLKNDKAAMHNLGIILCQGRSCGINVLFGAQELNAKIMPVEYSKNFATRILLGRTSQRDATRHAMSSKNTSQQIGSALVITSQGNQHNIQTLLVDDADIMRAKRVKR